jgi:hypothetical protein
MIAGLMPLTAAAQSTVGATRVAGRFVAVNYDYGASAPSLGLGNPPAPSIPPLRVYNGNAAAGSGTITLAQGYTVAPDGRTFFPLCAGSNVTGTITCGGATPITVNPGGANQETVTPTTISGCNLFPQNSSNPTCQVTATFSNVHAQGESIQSGSAGLQEAINDAIASGGGVPVIDALWTKAGGTQAMATGWTAPSGPVGVGVEDLRSVNFGYLVPTPGLTLIATPTAPTTASNLTTSTTGGSIATATTPRFTIVALDQFAGRTAASADTAATTTLVDGAGSTNSYGLSAAVFPTGTGIVGYELFVSASGGATQTETQALAANMTFTQSALCPVAACIAPGTAVTLTSLPATTNPGPPQGTSGAATALASAHTTVVIKSTGIPPTMLPFNDTAGPGYFPVTVTSATTLAAGFDVMGELPYPAGFFNNLNGKYQVCGGGVTTPSAATVAGTWALRLGPRENSAGTSGEHIVVPFGFVATNQWTAAASHFDFCTDFTISTTGTSGVVEGGGTGFCVTIAAGNDGAGTDTCVGAFNAASTATDLTVAGVLQLSYVQTAASWTVPQLRYFSIRKL